MESLTTALLVGHYMILARRLLPTATIYYLGGIPGKILYLIEKLVHLYYIMVHGKSHTLAPVQHGFPANFLTLVMPVVHDKVNNIIFPTVHVVLLTKATIYIYRFR